MYKMTKELYVVFHKKNLTSTFLLQNRLGRHTYTHFYMEGNARVEACLSHGVGAGFICFYECALQARHKWWNGVRVASTYRLIFGAAYSYFRKVDSHSRGMLIATKLHNMYSVVLWQKSKWSWCLKQNEQTKVDVEGTFDVIFLRPIWVWLM